jgi:hypothetical protein
MNELWVDIKGYEGHYRISNTGIVFSIKRGKSLIGGRNECGYAHVSLSKKNKTKTHRLNRLVAIHFIPNPDNLPEVNHKDGDKNNNSILNLEWSTVSHNRKHAYDLGLNKGRKK